MANGDGGILGHEHHGSGLAHHQGAADHNSVLALAVDAVVVQNFHAGRGGAGSEAQGLTFEDTGVRHVGHGVHVLAGGQAVADLVLVSLQVLGQRTEHQNAMDGGIGIDHSQNFFLGGSLGQDVVLNGNADFLSALGGPLLVAQVGGVLTQTDDTQSGNNALFTKGSGTGLKRSNQCFVYFLAQQSLSHSFFLHKLYR